MLKDNIRPFRYLRQGPKRTLLILDQLKLPSQEVWIRCVNHKMVADCIRDMNVRGAPAIGCVAAYGVALSAHEKKFASVSALAGYLEKVSKTLAATRPTAVNLFWALNRMMQKARTALGNNGKSSCSVNEIQSLLDREAQLIFDEDLKANHRMGELGAKLIPRNSVVLTHCNAGSLATSGWGTALGVIRAAYAQGRVKKVFVDETRPYLQGARLTAWELHKDGIPCELITDNMAAHMMKTENVGAVVVGSDRIARNGDVANKIGTYSLAVLCKYHKIPFLVAAPTSTIDLKISDGSHIPIEERSSREVTHVKGSAISPKGVKARHPAFDVSPHYLVSAIITEQGIARPPSEKTVRALFRPGSRRLIPAQ